MTGRTDRKRAEIAQAALAAFLRDGFDASMDLIAAEADASKVTIYKHFGNKEGLFTAVITDALSDALGDLLATIEPHLNAGTDIRESFLKVCRVWVAGTISPRVLTLRVQVAKEICRFPELGEVWLDYGLHKFMGAISGWLRELSNRGELNIPDTDLATFQLFGLVLSPHLSLNTFGAPADERLTEHLITTGVDMFLTYYERP